MSEVELARTVERVSLVDQVVASVKESIIDGTLKPGDRIKEVGLANALHIGHPTVREALIRLEHQGFVTRIPNRGTFVTSMSEEQVMEIFDIRECLEALALRRARQRITEDALAQVERLVKAMEQAAEAEVVDRPAYNEADRALHRTIVELSGNDRMAKILDNLTPAHLAAATVNPCTFREYTLAGAHWHRQLANCLTQGSEREVEEVVHQAFAFFRKHYLERIAMAKAGKDGETPREGGSLSVSKDNG